MMIAAENRLQVRIVKSLFYFKNCARKSWLELANRPAYTLPL